MGSERRRRVLRLCLLAWFWYVSCYFLMMIWTMPAYDTGRDTFFGSAYLLSFPVRVDGEFTVYAPGACWANWVFWPLDHPVRGLFDRADLSSFSSHVILGAWLLALGLTALTPFLSAVFTCRAKSPKTCALQVVLSLVPTAWYGALFLLYHLVRHGEIALVPGKIAAVAGTCMAVAALVWLGRIGSWIAVMPLTIAILSGTIWLVYSLPCA